MSKILALPSFLAGVAARVNAGEITPAKRMMRNVIEGGADDRSLRVIGWCAGVLENYPHKVAVQKLRWAWRYRADEQQRALIAACVPEQDSGQYRGAVEPTGQPPRYGWGNREAPRDSRSWVDRNRRRGPRSQRQMRRDADADRYFDEYEGRAGVAEGWQLADRDDRRIRNQPYASDLDFDAKATDSVHGLACLHCWGERSVTDATTERVLDDGRVRNGDDGLCSECRQSGRLGVPELPAEYSLNDAVAARCAYILEHYPARARSILIDDWRRSWADPARHKLIAAWAKAHRDELVAARCAFIVERYPANARELLVGEWQGADEHRRCLIEAWVEQHPLPEPASPDRQPALKTATPDLVNAAEYDRATVPAAAADRCCECCGSIRQVRPVTSDDEGTTALCVDCRKLESDPVQPALAPTAAEAA